MITEYRPKNFSEFVGQEDVIEYLQLKVNSSKKTGNALGHVLFLGPQGSGKTTLAHVVANELGTKIHNTSAVRMNDWKKIIGALSNLEEGDVLFIDEIHSLRRRLQENLYDVMEDFKADVFVDGEPITLEFPRFTLIGATTHAGNLNGPLLNRFSHKPMFAPYTIEQLTDMVIRANMRMYEDTLPKIVAEKIAHLSTRSARSANKLLTSYKEMAVVIDDLKPEDLIIKVAKMEGLDPWIGLNRNERKYLAALVRAKKKAEKNGMSPCVGSDTLASLLGENIDTVKNVIEPFLLTIVDFEGGREALVEVDKRGRRATDLAEFYIEWCQMYQDEQGWFSGEQF